MNLINFTVTGKLIELFYHTDGCYQHKNKMSLCVIYCNVTARSREDPTRRLDTSKNVAKSSVLVCIHWRVLNVNPFGLGAPLEERGKRQVHIRVELPVVICELRHVAHRARRG